MISFIGNRPALQVGHHQVIDYDTSWLDTALRRAAIAAEHDDFPFVDDIRSGVVKYLETKCPLKMLQLEELFERVRKMLILIGCERIAEELKPLAPPLTVSLVPSAMAAGNGFEIGFFSLLQTELNDLVSMGAEEIHFTGLRESTLILRGATKWDKHCQTLLHEIENFLNEWQADREGMPATLTAHP